MADFRLVFLATRPWSFPMTVLAVGYGLALAYWHIGYIDPLLGVLAIVGAVLLHAMVNLLNDYFDTKYGVDRPGAGTVEYRPHPLIHGFMSSSQVAGLGFGLGLLGLAIGTYIALSSRVLALVLGIVGFLLAYSYTGPPVRFKYIGLGELIVFLVWGPLMVLGGYYVVTGLVDSSVIIASIPLGLLVAAVLLANNIRDIDVDRKAGVYTLAVRLGKTKALRLYHLLLLGPFILTLLLAIIGLIPITTMATLLALPKALKLAKTMARSVPADADPRTANVVLIYAIVLLAATIIARPLGL